MRILKSKLAEAAAIVYMQTAWIDERTFLGERYFELCTADGNRERADSLEDLLEDCKELRKAYIEVLLAKKREQLMAELLNTLDNHNTVAVA